MMAFNDTPGSGDQWQLNLASSIARIDTMRIGMLKITTICHYESNISIMHLSPTQNQVCCLINRTPKAKVKFDAGAAHPCTQTQQRMDYITAVRGII